MARFLIITAIQWYQKILSPDHSWLRARFPYGYCRFHPTCSNYGIQAVEKYGALWGSAKAAWRIVRCNPFNDGGYDPVE